MLQDRMLAYYLKLLGNKTKFSRKDLLEAMQESGIKNNTNIQLRLG